MTRLRPYTLLDTCTLMAELHLGWGDPRLGVWYLDALASSSRGARA